MYEEMPGIYADPDMAIAYAKMLNHDHPSGDCCEPKWVVENTKQGWKVIKGNAESRRQSRMY